ncbi:MAG TPA: glycosyltransferase family 2 protein [Thermoleophilaceae bacterium]|nr:glycosyltransferase family 2 protein [Thermoleophilaceae bacterium]
MFATRLGFWSAVAGLLYAHAGYTAVLALIRRTRPRERAEAPADANGAPTVSLIVAAHNEAGVIAAKVGNALGLDYPRDRLEIVVVCDGCTDATAQEARAAGADLVIELPRGGKVPAQDAAVERTTAEVLAFSDANAMWEPGALRSLVRALSDADVAYACGQVRFVDDGGTNQEGLYWRYEMLIRQLESDTASITAGNGAIYAVKRSRYLRLDPLTSHDLSLPFNLVKRGHRAVYVPEARATERMVPTVEGEFRRKRRMMAHAWPTVAKGGLLSPRGYDATYGLMVWSHRGLRYATPLLHAVAFGSNVLLARSSRLYRAALALQLALGLAAVLGGSLHLRPLLVARYYVLTTLAIAAGAWDWLRHGTDPTWESAEGTR